MLRFDNFDLAYKAVVQEILDYGVYKPDRTGVGTLSLDGFSFKIDISKNFPLLTLKDMRGGAMKSLKEEFLWYLTGEHHIRNFSKKSKIWDNWADGEGNLGFAYGRFWRRFPVPPLRECLEGEAWPYGTPKGLSPWVKEEDDVSIIGYRVVRLVFDQVHYIRDTLRDNPWSRRMLLTAHHPANAAFANPPACHVNATFNVRPDSDGNPKILNCHLHMRSNDVGLGMPFNIAQYALLTHLFAKDAGMRVGSLSYTGVDVHLYTGEGENKKYCQLQYAQEILNRETKSGLPTLHLTNATFDSVKARHIQFDNYDPHPHIKLICVP